MRDLKDILEDQVGDWRIDVLDAYEAGRACGYEECEETLARMREALFGGRDDG